MSTYYSQHGQDRWLDENIFKGKTGGFFVDIGALDGEAISNTLFFEESRGWTGVTIEPKPDMAEKLRNRRSCECIEGCLSNRPEDTVTFVDVEGWAECLSGIEDSYDPAHVQRINDEIRAHGGSKRTIEVKNYRFNDIISQTHIDYVSLDTEGSEMEILESIDFEKYQIDCFSIENNYEDQRISTFMKSHGYYPIVRLGVDVIWIKAKK